MEISYLAYTLKSRNIDTVFHLAALARVQPSIEDPITFNNINVNGTLNLLFACHKANVNRVIYSASSSAYGDAEILPTSEDVHYQSFIAIWITKINRRTIL